MESIERNKKYCKEHDGMVLGLARAIDTVKIEAEEEDQERPPP